MLLRQLGRVSIRMGYVVQKRSARAVLERMFELIDLTAEEAI